MALCKLDEPADIPEVFVGELAQRLGRAVGNIAGERHVHNAPPLTILAHLPRVSRSDSSAARRIASCSWSTCRSMHSRANSRSLLAGIASSSTDVPTNFFALVSVILV